jgi:hypothetical protein
VVNHPGADTGFGCHVFYGKLKHPLFNYTPAGGANNLFPSYFLHSHFWHYFSVFSDEFWSNP